MCYIASLFLVFVSVIFLLSILLSALSPSPFNLLWFSNDSHVLSLDIRLFLFPSSSFHLSPLLFPAPAFSTRAFFLLFYCPLLPLYWFSSFSDSLYFMGCGRCGFST